jgi:trimethylamine:corrinoid methyltransferase-like protein
MSQTCLFDRSNRGDWENKGKPQSYAKALSRAIEIIENHKPESLPESATLRIRSIVEEAEKEVGIK